MKILIPPSEGKAKIQKPQNILLKIPILYLKNMYDKLLDF